jgi:hypothetical protein
LYRDKSQSKRVLGEALREAYEDLFHINERPSDSDKQAIIGRFKSTHNATDLVAERQAATFLSLLKQAELPNPIGGTPKTIEQPKPHEAELPKPERDFSPSIHAFSGLRYNIEVHLPATKDVEVYNAIFKSLREHLLND